MPSDESTSRFARRLLTLVAAVAIFNGFVNLVPIAIEGNYLSTTLIDAFLAVAIIQLLVLWMHGAKKAAGSSAWAPGVVLVLVAYIFLFGLSDEPASAKLLAIRSNIGYAFFGLYAAVALRISEDRERLIVNVLRMSTVVALFGLAQAFFLSRLPEQLWAPVDAPVVFGYFGTDVSRTNGLLGNTIVFGAFLSMFYGIHLARWVARPTLLHAATTAVHLVALFTTYSRVALVAAGGITVVAIVFVSFRRAPASTIFWTGLTVAASPFALYGLWPHIQSYLGASFVAQQVFLGRNRSVQGSNDLHDQGIELAQESFQEHPWTGIGIATQQYGSSYELTHRFIVTDGALWARLMEGGLLLVLAYAVLLGGVLWTLWRIARSEPGNYVAVGLLVFLTYQCTLASLYNSALFGKAVFVCTWVVLGIVTAGREASDTQRDDRPKRLVRSVR